MNQSNLNFFNLLKIISACIIAFFLHWNYHFIQFLGINIKSSILSSRILQFLLRGPIGYMSVCTAPKILDTRLEVQFL